MPLLPVPFPAYSSFPTLRKERKGWGTRAEFIEEEVMEVEVIEAVTSEAWLSGPWVSEAGGELCC